MLTAWPESAKQLEWSQCLTADSRQPSPNHSQLLNRARTLKFVKAALLLSACGFQIDSSANGKSALLHRAGEILRVLRYLAASPPPRTNTAKCQPKAIQNQKQICDQSLAVSAVESSLGTI